MRPFDEDVFGRPWIKLDGFEKFLAKGGKNDQIKLPGFSTWSFFDGCFISFLSGAVFLPIFNILETFLMCMIFVAFLNWKF